MPIPPRVPSSYRQLQNNVQHYQENIFQVDGVCPTTGATVLGPDFILCVAPTRWGRRVANKWDSGGPVPHPSQHIWRWIEIYWDFPELRVEMRAVLVKSGNFFKFISHMALMGSCKQMNEASPGILLRLDQHQQKRSKRFLIRNGANESEFLVLILVRN